MRNEEITDDHIILMVGPRDDVQAAWDYLDAVVQDKEEDYDDIPYDELDAVAVRVFPPDALARTVLDWINSAVADYVEDTDWMFLSPQLYEVWQGLD